MNFFTATLTFLLLATSVAGRLMGPPESQDFALRHNLVKADGTGDLMRFNLWYFPGACPLCQMMANFLATSATSLQEADDIADAAHEEVCGKLVWFLRDACFAALTPARDMFCELLKAANKDYNIREVCNVTQICYGINSL